MARNEWSEQVKLGSLRANEMFKRQGPDKYPNLACLVVKVSTGCDRFSPAYTYFRISVNSRRISCLGNNTLVWVRPDRRRK